MKTNLQTECCPAPTNERTQTTQFIAPDVNIYETKDGYLLEAEMPGVNKDGVEITLEGHEITLTGRHAAEVVPGEPLFRERQTTDYRRVFELDPAIDTSHIAARMNQGVLILTLPKSEKVKSRKITIND